MNDGNYTFYEDGGHGWLEVGAAMCRQLKLQGKISGYSYGRNDKLYLEEDRDAGVFIDAYNLEIGGFDEGKVKRVYHDGQSPVRNYGAIPDEFLKVE